MLATLRIAVKEDMKSRYVLETKGIKEENIRKRYQSSDTTDANEAKLLSEGKRAVLASVIETQDRK